MNKFNFIIAVSAIVAVFIAACNPTYTVQGPEDKSKIEKTITVTGIARLEVEPDEASVNFTFSSTDKKIAKAHKSTKERVDQFINSLKEVGIPAEDVVLGYTNYSPDYSYKEGEPAKIVTFTTSTTLVVKTKDFKKIPAIIEKGIESNLTSLGGIEFYSTKLPEHKKKVRDMAIKAARDKAEQIAKGLDIKIGKAINVYEGAWNSSASRYYGGPSGWGGWGWGAPMANVAQQVSTAGTGGEMAGPMSPGTIPLNLTIDCIFEIK